VEHVFGEAGKQGLIGWHDQHGHRVVLGDVGVLCQQRQRVEAATACADLVQATRAFDHHQVLQDATLLDRGCEFGDAQPGLGVGRSRLIGLGENELVERDGSTG
jgi:hypothetical protein